MMAKVASDTISPYHKRVTKSHNINTNDKETGL